MARLVLIVTGDWVEATDQCNTDGSSVRSSSSGDGTFLSEADFASAVAKAAEMSGLTVVGTTVCDLNNKASECCTCVYMEQCCLDCYLPRLGSSSEPSLIPRIKPPDSTLPQKMPLIGGGVKRVKSDPKNKAPASQKAQ